MEQSVVNRPEERVAEEEEINLLELVRVIVRRKRTIITLCAVAVLLSVAYSLTLPNIYTATAKILPPQKESGGGLSALLSQAGGLAGLAGGMGLGGSSELYIGILKSRSVADAVIKKLDLTTEFRAKTPDEARNALAGVVKVQAGKDGIISVSADSKDPKKAAILANAMVEELGRRSVQLNLSKVGTERVFLEKRLEVVKADLKKAEDELRRFAEQNRAIRVDAQATASIQGIAQLKAEIVSKEVQLESLRSFQTDESPEIKALRAGIARLKGQLGAMAGSGRSSDAILPVGSVPNLGLEYARLLREQKIQETIFEQLTKQYEMAKLNEAKDSSSIQVLDEAVAPTKKSKPKRLLIVLLSTVTAFFVGIFWVFIQEYLGKMSNEDRAIWQDIKESCRLRPGKG
ncbi:GumC family protein [Geobacter argillaceus]|uniref:Uncharacterized protein involved in exopolysaccharide biosynthesis n=1 Tax=Geobacter argillaceus TaxID=345631 RepID=A0A562VGM8_9BACT|nr:Wzz/FepE/Etk N-terminal domain-containing protein [Geobacter argillaceus]TWJ17076.1 uncharacterized protein involved in exopolysaccharide biosynthesis [Geobacter argillaceus]